MVLLALPSGCSRAAGWAELLLPCRPATLLHTLQHSVPLTVALCAHTLWSLVCLPGSGAEDAVPELHLLTVQHCWKRGLDRGPGCLLLPKRSVREHRGEGTWHPCTCVLEEHRAWEEGGRDIMHRHRCAPDGTRGAAETSAVEVDSSICVPVLVKGHWGYSGPSRVCWCWVPVAARCHPGCALQILLCEEPREQLSTALIYHCINAIAALR